ncbi:MAG: FAD/NAD(P)-binding protein [Planctomycetota bacterium]|nr:FAD/NAD(P)-binding protein [Planctomycetota bacterium]
MSVVNRASLPNQLDPWKTSTVTVNRLRAHTSGVFSIDLSFEDPDVGKQFEFVPGQFNMLYVPGVGEAAISIAGTNVSGMLQHTIRTVGAVTTAIEKGGVGMSLGLRGPFGRGWPLEPVTNSTAKVSTSTKNDHPKNGDVIIVAGGIGLAPLRSMVEHIGSRRAEYGTVSIVVGARSPGDLLYQDEYEDWRSRKMKVICTVDRASLDWKGQIGVVTLLLERLEISHPSLTTFMTCGPEVMMRYAAKSAINRGIPEAQIYVTLERNMNCAIGLCGHCQLGPNFICKDGPVFRYNSVSALLRVQEL